MSFPRRDPRDGQQQPGRGQPAPLDTVPTGGDDLAPTGEHMPADLMELSGADLEVDEEESSAGPTMAATPRSVGVEPPGPMPVTHQPSPLFPDEAGNPSGIDPMAQTMPPESLPADPVVDQGASFAPDMDPMTDQEGLDPLEEAPTRIEREEDIRAGFEESAPQQGPRLLIIGGNNRGKEYGLKLGDNSIGRGVDNDIILADIAVSRKHTLVCYEGNDFVVRDLGSGNGTLLNGKRVDAKALRDGDQMELGNTLMRFVHPLAAVAPAPADPGQLASMATVVTPQHQVDGDMARATADIRRPLPAPVGTVKERRGKRKLLATRRQKLLVFGGVGVVLLLGLMVGLKVWLNAKKEAAQQAAQQDARPPDELAAQEYQAGIKQYRIRNWEQARLHLVKVMKLVPKADHAQHYLKQVNIEIAARDALERAKNALGAKDFPTVRKELVKIPSTSVYGPEAQKLKQKVDDTQLSKLLVDIRALKEGDDLDGARAKLKEAMEIAPTNPEVVKLSADLTEGSGEETPRHVAVRRHAPGRKHVRRPAARPAPKPKQPSATPIRIRGGKLKAVLALYKQKQWGQAHKDAKALAESSRGRAKKAADATAKEIYQVGMAWNRAQKAASATARVKYYQIALRHDRKLRGVHQATLKSLVIAACKAVVAKAVAQRHYTTAAKAIQIAERHGGGGPTFQRAKQVLEKQAMDMFTKGYTVRSSNPAQARRMWQQVLKMVPPSSAAYKRAYQWLNNSAPSYQDEDED